MENIEKIQNNSETKTNSYEGVYTDISQYIYLRGKFKAKEELTPEQDAERIRLEDELERLKNHLTQNL